MPRDSSGNYTLPSPANPVVDGTVIDVNWANPTMADIAVQLNNVLTRDGLLAPVHEMYFVDGTPALPGIAFAAANGTGMWRSTTQLGVSWAGVPVQTWSAAGSNIAGPLLDIGMGTTAGVGIELGRDRVAEGSAFIDFHSHVGTDFDARLIKFDNANAGSFRIDNLQGDLDLFNRGAWPIRFMTNNVERMIIDTNGNVGIGAAPGGWRFYVDNPTPNGMLVHSVAGGIDAYFGTGTGWAQVGSVTNHPLVLTTNSEERMRIDEAGNVGIGNVPVGSRLNILGGGMASSSGLSISSNSGAGRLVPAGTDLSSIHTYLDTSVVEISAASSPGNISGIVMGGLQAASQGGPGMVRFFTGSAERMRIEAAGVVKVLTGAFWVGSPPLASQQQGSVNIYSGGYHVVLSGAANGTLWRMFQNGTNGTLHITTEADVGVILPQGATAWVAFSDERAKTNLQPIQSAVAKVDTLRAVTGELIADESHRSRSFLIAQDVQAVLPQAVYTDENGMLGLAYTEVIPLLVAAIKELNAKVDSL